MDQTVDEGLLRALKIYFIRQSAAYGLDPADNGIVPKLDEDIDLERHKEDVVNFLRGRKKMLTTYLDTVKQQLAEMRAVLSDDDVDDEEKMTVWQSYLELENEMNSLFEGMNG